MTEKDITAAEFLSDPYFREWVLWPDAENSPFWEHWLKLHPHREEEMQWARQLILSMQQAPHTLPEERVNKLWSAIEAGMDGTPAQAGLALRPGEPSARWSACLLGLLAAGLGWLMVTNVRTPCQHRQGKG